jgi:peptidoglycan/LPS O-acetylase OafA/YrhL
LATDQRSDPEAASAHGEPGARPRLQALTGIRIVAALAVFMSHVGPPHGSPGFLAAFMSSGYGGVTLFFVLSGFVLTINYYERLRSLRPRRLYNYFVARFARVYPLYALILLYFIVRQHAFGESISGWWRNALAVQAWDGNLTHLFSFDPPSWSISVEFFLYACFPVLVPLVGLLRNKRAVLAGGLVVAGLIFAAAAWFVLSGRESISLESGASSHRWLYLMPLPRLGDFLLGMLAARLYMLTRSSPGLVRRLGSPLVWGASVLVVALMCWPRLLDTAWSWDLTFAIPAVLIIFGLAAAPDSLPAKALATPKVVFFGEASYAFYLVHFPLIVIFGLTTWDTTMSASLVVYEFLSLGMILALAAGLHIGVERPARVHVRRWLELRGGGGG